jgi:hypothetical protein
MGAVNSKAGDAGALYLRDQTRCMSFTALSRTLLTADSLGGLVEYYKRPQSDPLERHA